MNIPCLYKTEFEKLKASERQIERSYGEWQRSVRQTVRLELEHLRIYAESVGQTYHLIDRKPGGPGADLGYDQLGLTGHLVVTGNVYKGDEYERELIHPAEINFLISKRGLLNVFMTPARSTTSTLPNEPILVYYSYKPSELTKLKLRGMLAKFLWYERCTMFYGSRTLLDSLKLRWFSHMDVRNRDAMNGKVLGLLHQWMLVVVGVVLGALLTG